MNNVSSVSNSVQVEHPLEANVQSIGESKPDKTASHMVLPTPDYQDIVPLCSREVTQITSTEDSFREFGQDIFFSEKLKKSIAKLSKHSSKDDKQVGLIVRFNNNDALTEVFWSEQYVFLDEPPLSLGYMREKAKNVVLKRTGYALSTCQPDLGGHCEEILIRSWKRLIKYNECYPKNVDIVLTLDPCMNQSTLFLDERGHLWPAGCSPKLYKLISEEKQTVQWNIILLQVNSNRFSDAAIEKLKRHPKVRVFTYNPDDEGSLVLMT
jgi:hypothetical protein